MIFQNATEHPKAKHIKNNMEPIWRIVHEEVGDELPYPEIAFLVVP